MKSAWLKLSLLSVVVTGGCAGVEIYPAHSLVDQIIMPRAGYDGKLTNRTCGAYKDGKCSDEKIQTYDLSDALFRKTANDLKFLCNVGGRRFKICMDKPGFCRFSSETYKCGFLGLAKCSKQIEEYLPASPYQFLLDAKVKCSNKENYPFEGL